MKYKKEVKRREMKCKKEKESKWNVRMKLKEG